MTYAEYVTSLNMVLIINHIATYGVIFCLSHSYLTITMQNRIEFEGCFIKTLRLRLLVMRKIFLLLLFLFLIISLTFVNALIVPQNARDLPLAESTCIYDKVAVLEPLTLTLDVPSIIRLDDIAVIRLTVTVDERSNVAIGLIDYPSMILEDASDAFESYYVIAVAKLDLPRLYFSPPDRISQPLRAGQSITFTWSVHADSLGEYAGTVWFLLRFVPKGEDVNSTGQVTGQVSELTLAAIPIALHVISFLGLKGSTARILGTLGIFISILVALPFLLDRFTRPVH